MADTIYLSDGDTEVILDKGADYINLIRRKLGTDAAKQIGQYIAGLQGDADYTQRKVKTDLDCYESSLESNRDAFQEVLDLVKSLKNNAWSARIDKQKLLLNLDMIETTICNQI